MPDPAYTAHTGAASQEMAADPGLYNTTAKQLMLEMSFVHIVMQSIMNDKKHEEFQKHANLSHTYTTS
eukprot:828548-Ditylum_brightwellii.AAC.1